MSDTSGGSPPAPASDTSTTPPPSSDTSSSPPPQSDQGSSSSPSSPPPPDNTPPSLLPPLLPSPPTSNSSPPPSSPPPSPPPPDSNLSPPPSASPPPTPTSPPPQSPPPPPDKSAPVSSPPPKKKSPPPPSPPPPNPKSPPPAPSSDPPSPPPPLSEFKPPPPPISPSLNPSPGTPVNPNPPAYSPPPTAPDSKSSPPRSDSSSDPSSSSSAPASSSPTSRAVADSAVHSGAVAGVALAGVFLVLLIAMYFVCSSRRRRRKKSDAYAAGHYLPATISIKSEGYYQGQQHNINFSNSGPKDGFYSPQNPNSFMANSYGSQRGVANPGGGLDTGGLMGGPNPYFSYEELMDITDGFSRQNVLGEGGFGCVYKGWLPDGKSVAVKQLKAGSGQGEREFKAEVEIISRVHHRHLVSLVGYCISENHRLLVYDFVPNQTLEHHLHGVGMPVLDWSKRLKIALGAAKGLAYLHEDCHPKIIHRDIKSANILLEESFEAQVADFGLAKPSNDTHTHVSTRVMGTFGYMAPEYASSGKLTDRSDVFSFGVVLLELVTGRKPVDPTRPLGDESLVEWARPLLISALETGDLSELVDPKLGKHYVESEMMRMVEAAAACVRHSAPKRPRMVQVSRALDCEGEMSDLSNGVKYGQSTIYDSGQYNQDIMKFRKMALEDSSEYDAYSGEFGKPREVSGNQSSWKPSDGSSSESETRAFHGEQRYGGLQSNFGGRQF